MVDLIDNAKSNIDIATYLLTEKCLLAALHRALGNGVVVRILVASVTLNTGIFDEMEKYQPHSLERFMRATVKYQKSGQLSITARQLVHTKLMLIDGTRAIVGSSLNFTASAAYYNYEAFLVTRDLATIAAYREALHRWNHRPYSDEPTVKPMHRCVALYYLKSDFARQVCSTCLCVRIHVCV
jgi:phosphatidylserine/phosphatidylglycerophosphate/cardiolipin synthase-like enzyme